MLVFKVDNWIYDSRSGCCCVVVVALFSLLFLFVVSLFAGFRCCFVLKRSNRRGTYVSSTKIENFLICCCFFFIFMQKNACKRSIYVN